MSYRQKRLYVNFKNQINVPLSFNPFVFSRLFFLWVVVGLLGGIIAGSYWICLELFTNYLHIFTGPSIIVLMTVAGLLAGLVIHYLGDPGEMNLIVNNIRFKGGELEPKNNISMFLSSLICIASGGSLGPEAPLVQITGSTGTWIAKRLKIKGEQLRTLTIAGMASGFTALFGAPLGGSLFALEILHHKHVAEYYEAIIPAIVASLSSFIVFVIITQIGIGPSWNFETQVNVSLLDFLSATLYSLPAVAAGWLFIFLVKKFNLIFSNIKLPEYLKMALGGLLIGILVFYFPITRYFSHNEMKVLLTTDCSINYLITILFVKLIVIALTVASGWRGGFIIPLFFVGTTLGLVLHHFMPDGNLSLMMVSSIAAINACVTRTPLSTVILVSTMTGFHNFIPITFASLSGFFLAPKIPLINAQLGFRDDSE